MTPTTMPYQYVVLRCVPRPDREEFLNVGVVLFCEEADYLDVVWHLDRGRLETFAPAIPLERLEAALDAVDALCRGEAHAGFEAGTRATAYGVRALADTTGARFGLIRAPKSTVLQPGPVHGGLTDDAPAELARLLTAYVA